MCRPTGRCQLPWKLPAQPALKLLLSLDHSPLEPCLKLSTAPQVTTGKHRITALSSRASSSLYTHALPPPPPPPSDPPNRVWLLRASLTVDCWAWLWLQRQLLVFKRYCSLCVWLHCSETQYSDQGKLRPFIRLCLDAAESICMTTVL